MANKLYLVIGYKDKSLNAETAEVLYLGSDGAKTREIRNTPNADFPVREAFHRPYPNGGRRVDVPAPEQTPAEETPAPIVDGPTEQTPAEETPVEDPAPKSKKK